MSDVQIQSSSQMPFETRRRDWIARVEALVNQIAEWSLREKWTVERHEKSITERLLGTYEVTEVIVRPDGGELLVNPVGLHVSGGNGRVDLEGIPTLSRINLIGVADGWQIWTDSNVPLRVDWNRDTFVQLVRDLLN
ncbi:MAG TPA: hypothetical protein VG326_00770 [Tepidisphaeraceae bacterium]|jgi:hypothetical protein|nr:hypothetical protein [Tepidisphaeraceae bacterium]